MSPLYRVLSDASALEVEEGRPRKLTFNCDLEEIEIILEYKSELSCGNYFYIWKHYNAMVYNPETSISM